ncbi:class I SAM-dependent methyltransferase [Microvirga terricola]|uniref:Methyltransferase domain-containing protein n=1 Tax=Microvirga terricola TaxID=2719797 RepID=A0ABX0VAT0_9HYPH|nr:class I SAM-dependent methyltransferase [Microvirga terricola]NIX76294.1 methyltransferase domain-containing protein [Microvirga terricola]
MSFPLSEIWKKSNLSNWNKRAALHIRDATGFYDIDGFIAGRDTLYPVEASEIGDVKGKRLLHLQCHFGLDSLSLARRGAIVTGLDFSPTAVTAARDLAARANLQAAFVESDVYDARQSIKGEFDLVYTTWGTICWLPDIKRWAKVVADMLAPGGSFYFADSHPCAQMLDEREGRIVPSFAWRTPVEKPDVFEETQSYTGDVHDEASTQYNWIHPLSDIIGSLMEAGLRLETLSEHELLPYKLFPSMVSAGHGMFRLPDGAVPIPLSVSLRMVKGMA